VQIHEGTTRNPGMSGKGSPNSDRLRTQKRGGSRPQFGDKRAI